MKRSETWSWPLIFQIVLMPTFKNINKSFSLAQATDLVRTASPFSPLVCQREPLMSTGAVRRPLWGAPCVCGGAFDVPKQWGREIEKDGGRGGRGEREGAERGTAKVMTLREREREVCVLKMRKVFFQLILIQSFPASHSKIKRKKVYG